MSLMDWTTVRSFDWRGFLRKLPRTIGVPALLWALLWLFGCFTPIFLGLLWLASDLPDVLPDESYKEILPLVANLSTLLWLGLYLITRAIGVGVSAAAIVALGFWMMVFGGWAGFIVFSIGFSYWFKREIRTFLVDALDVWRVLPTAGKAAAAAVPLLLIAAVALAPGAPYPRAPYTSYDAVLFEACAEFEEDGGFADRAALFRQAAAFVTSEKRAGPPVLRPPAGIAERCIRLEATAVIAASKPIPATVP